MPAYHDLHNFLNQALLVDSKLSTTLKRGYGRGSSLKSLVSLLQEHNCTAARIVAELRKLVNKSDSRYVTKANKYKSAIYHLQHTYPVPHAMRVPVFKNNQSTRSQAVRYTTNHVQPTVTRWQKGDENKPSTWIPVSYSFSTPQSIDALTGTVEDYMLSNPGTGVVIIHLQEEQNDMRLLFDGFTGKSHIASVIKTARVMNSPVCALRVDRNLYPVAGFLTSEYNRCSNKISPMRPLHSGFSDPGFQQFVAQNQNIVVTGFQMDICVHINIFGGEKVDRTEQQRAADIEIPAALQSSLLAQCNVITSKPLLVTGGGGNSNRMEYGILQNK